MNGRRGFGWWLANAALWVCSAVFLLPFLWLLLTALKPIEQTMSFQWLPKSYRAPIDGQRVEVIKERQVSEDSVIVTIREGKRSGERQLFPATAWDGQKAQVEEQQADIVIQVQRTAELEKQVPAGWWRVREKSLRKYAEREPRWDCVPEEQIEEGVRFWWENFGLAVEYLSDRDQTPLKAAWDDGTSWGGWQGYRLRWQKIAKIDLTRFDTLRLRIFVPIACSVRLWTLPQDRSLPPNDHPELATAPWILETPPLEAGTHDVDISILGTLRAKGWFKPPRIESLGLEVMGATKENGLLDRVQVSEARLIHHRATFWTYLGNTLIVCVLGCLGTVLSSSLVAYGFARVQWPHRDKVFWVVLATMMVPFPVTMIPLFGIFRDLGWVGTLKPLWVPAFFGSAFNIFLLRQFFLTIPQELSDAARIDGCSEFGIYWRIILPLSRPALAVVVLFHFLYAWNDFMGPLIYLTKPSTFTLSLALQFYQSQHGGSEWHLLMAMSVLILLPIVVLFFFTQKTFIQGIATSGMKG